MPVTGDEFSTSVNATKTTLKIKITKFLPKIFYPIVSHLYYTVSMK